MSIKVSDIPYWGFTCNRCGKVGGSKDYGGYSLDKYGDLCIKCWNEFIEIKHRQSRELDEFWQNRMEMFFDEDLCNPYLRKTTRVR